MRTLLLLTLLGLGACGGSSADDAIACSGDVELTSSVEHCGSCGTRCLDGPDGVATCEQGRCVLACTAGFADCDGQAETGCETPLSSAEHCGACGVTCGSAEACVNGACQLAAACAVPEAEHPSATTPGRDGALCGNRYTEENLSSACGVGWSVCTLTQWKERFSPGMRPGGALTSWGSPQSERATGHWLAGAPGVERPWDCGPSLCDDGYTPYGDGKFLFDDTRSQVLVGDGGCCGWDLEFAPTPATDSFAVYCCKR